ncbi:sensor histidine kinase [Candidatus Omnitrophota bacterium]
MEAFIQNLNIDTFVDWLAYISLFSVICLVVALMTKIERTKRLKRDLDKIKRSFDQLDEQAKLIVRTDLELNKTQEELDKKVTGLYTLQRISHLVSTTLDENELFSRIKQPLISALGFEKALILIFDQQHGYAWKTTFGFSQDQLQAFLSLLKDDPLLTQVAQDGKSVNSAKMPVKDIDRLSRALDIASFIINPILTQDGVIGIMLVGNSPMAPALTEGDQDIMSILTTQLGQSIENARLFEEVFKSHQDLERKVQLRTRELANALEQVKKISKAKSQFVSAVSHELRTPLTSIKGYASILMAGTMGEIPEQIKERLAKINKHSDSLVQLINNLLDISRIESGKLEMRFETKDVREIVENISDMLMPQTKEKQITLALEIPTEVAKVHVDLSQIERVFINLISNALKFTPEKGTITVEAKDASPEFIQVDIIDTGIGISEADLTHIFDEFYRVDNPINQSLKGTGLGLPLVKYIVEAHRGTIWVTSTQNEGTCFSFTLPKAL